ncbi:MAG: hypothetical protein QM689_03700 [Oscillospiraceae bacterium]
MNFTTPVSYTYRNIAIPGGGFVTGFAASPRGTVFARTDIGGLYRLDGTRWKPLLDAFGPARRHVFQPLAITAADGGFYAVCGDVRQSCLLISCDEGERFTELPVPFTVNGNHPARGTGERLAAQNGALFFGSQGEGLFRSANEGESWERLGFPENDLTFVAAHPTKRLLIVSATGETSAVGNTRAPALFYSCDGGERFTPLPVPEAVADARSVYSGFVGVSCAFDENNAYVSFSAGAGKSFGGWNNFACDNGGGFDGRLWRYVFTETADGFSCAAADITPVLAGFADDNPARRLPFGLGGVSCAGGRVLCASYGGRGERLYLSENAESAQTGGAFREIFSDRALDRYDCDVPYLAPEHNGGRIPLHWMSSVLFLPNDPEKALVVTGTGVFLLSAIGGEARIAPFSDGIEETVHVLVKSPPVGDVRLLDLVGDLGGFAVKAGDTACGNSFSDAAGNRFITCTGVDFTDQNPRVGVVCARGNWTGATKGGLLLTNDGFQSFMHAGYPDGLSPELDRLCAEMRRPNVNGGWCAISADGSVTAWGLSDGKFLPAACAVRFADGCFETIGFHGAIRSAKIIADRVRPDRFYAFGENGQIFVSSDKARNFFPAELVGAFVQTNFALVDSRGTGDIAAFPFEAGKVLAFAPTGIFVLEFSPRSAAVRVRRITPETCCVSAAGLGKNNAIYTAAELDGAYGIWRTENAGGSWTRLNADDEKFGVISSICGDSQNADTFYFGTSTRGLFCAEKAARP